MAEAIVLHDAVSYTHPDHQGEGRKNLVPGVPPALATATRGQKIPLSESDDYAALPHIDKKELKRLEALGAVTTDANSLDARLALAGHRPDSRMSGPYTSLTSDIEQRRAAIAIAQMAGGSGPQSRKADLARLQIGDLQRLAAAFGAPTDVYEDADKDKILDFLAGDDEHAEDKTEAAQREQLRDEAQVGAREFAGTEGGRVGTNVTGTGLRADTGLATEREEGGTAEKAAPKKRPSRAQKQADES